MQKKAAVALAVLGAVCLARTARASCTAPLISPCIDSDTFWPHAGPQQFMTVGSTETLAKDTIGFGLVASYLKQPIVLASPSPGPTGNSSPAVDDLLDLTFLFAYGLTRHLELDLALPVTVFEDGAGTSPIVGGNNDVPATASRDVRFGFTYSFLRRPNKHPWRHDARGFGVAARFEMVAPTGDDSAFATEPSAVYAPSVSVDYRSRWFFAGAEVGMRIRPVTDFVGARIGTQALIAIGAGFDILDKELLSVTGEARWLPGFAQQGTVAVAAGGLQSLDNGMYIAPAEWMVSVRSAPFEGGDITFQLGAGGGLPVSQTCSITGSCSLLPITTPSFRAALGIIFAPRGRDTDGDGIPDAVDRCPLDPAPKSVGTGNGCPPTP